MSKKAEELADEVYNNFGHGNCNAIELIDNALRKERERCADRASAYFDSRLANEPICPTNWKIGLRSAILDDKED